MADGYLTFDTKLNTAGFKSGLGQVTGMFTKLAALAGVAFSVGAVVAFGRAAVQAAGQAEAKFKGLEFLMRANGRSMSQATSFIKEFTADGLVPMTSAYESYKNMVSRGYSTEQIEKMLAVMKDAAVYNRQGQFSMGEAMEKATMGLRMENSLLTDSVGIQKNVAKMWQEHAQTLGTTASNLTMAQKRQAEFNGFMKEGGVFAGAAGGYLNSYAGKMGQLTSSFTNLKVAVGNAVIPFINALLPAINAAILWFTKLFNIIGRVVNLLFGTNVGMVDAEAAIAGSAEQTAAATGETAANTEAAGKAAKGALASFDKLNVLAQDTSGEGGGGGGAGGGAGGLPSADQAGGLSDELDKLKEKFSSVIALITGSFASGDFTEIATSVSNAVIGALTEARKKIQGFDFEQFGSDIGKGVNQVAKSVKSFLENINFKEIGTQYSGLLSDVFKGMLDTGIGFLQEVNWQEVGDTIWTGIESAIEFVWGWLTGIDWAGLVSRAFELLGSALGAAAGVIAGLASAIWETLKKAWGAVKDYFDGFKEEAGGDVWQGILDGIANAAVNIYEFIRDNIVKPFVDGFVKAFGEAELKAIWDDIKTWSTQAWEDIKKAWEGVGEWFDTKVIQPVKDFFSNMWDDIKQWASDTWDDIKRPFEKAAEWFDTTVVKPVEDFFRPMFEWLGIVAYDTWLVIKYVWEIVSGWFNDNVITPIKDWFKQAWEDIKGFFTGAWDKIKEVWGVVSDWFNTNVVTPVKDWFTEAWDTISDKITGVWDKVKLAWEGAKEWFQTTILDPVKEAFETTWETISGAVETAFNTVGDVIKGVLNGAIDILNKAIGFIFDGINELINKANTLGSKIPGWRPIDPLTAPVITPLAAGAVIPPNAPFMAVMGDQRRGTNLEAPESLIRQIVREEAGNAGGQNITITFGGTMGELVRQLKPHIERETNRAGGSMLAKAVRA